MIELNVQVKQQQFEIEVKRLLERSIYFRLLYHKKKKTIPVLSSANKTLGKQLIVSVTKTRGTENT